MYLLPLFANDGRKEERKQRPNYFTVSTCSNTLGTKCSMKRKKTTNFVEINHCLFKNDSRSSLGNIEYKMNFFVKKIRFLFHSLNTKTIIIILEI